MRDLLFDISCLDIGLPPMSGKAEDVYEMIKNMPSSRRRQINRKLKKICKRFISTKVYSLSSSDRDHKEKIYRKHLGFKTSEELINNSKLFAIRRIATVQTFLRKK